MDTTTSTIKERTNKTSYSAILNGKIARHDDRNGQTLIAIPQRMQARLDATQTARYLNFQAHDIPVLVQHGLLKPLGNPSPNSVKYFASFIIEQLGQDIGWLEKATQIMADYWRGKNDKKTKN